MLKQFPIDPETQKVKYTDIVKFEGMTKDQLYHKAKLWIVSTLKSGDNMVELNGTSSDQIVGTGNLLLDSVHHYVYDGFYAKGQLNFKFIIFCKEGRLKYSVENFLFTFKVSQNDIRQKAIEDLLIKPESEKKKEKKKKKPSFEEKNIPYLDSQIKALIADFLYKMNKSDEDDW
ncbi:MAG: DUF4468 domain-containing protein [Bacteroidetes bacterium]|nr:DUF4468 domain-containing protein [Bacteroidota bacterium]MBT6685535.1 DUF4468 domain-containing protein [Bacteroidota bacterium]MBT7491602.1 DUF4468 domain-containing protein [Bacteroidota bacterium]